jgi:propionyl-CoA synthetase
VIEEHKVSVLFTAPTAFRAIRKEDPEGEFIASTTSPASARSFSPASAAIPTRCSGPRPSRRAGDRPWWQTETGGRFAANPLGVEKLPVKPGSPTLPMPGYDVQILDEEGQEGRQARHDRCHRRQAAPAALLPADALAGQRPLQAGLPHPLSRLLLTGDAGYIDEDGYLFIMSRIDDIINVAGHRLSTAAWRRSWPGTRTSPNAP